LETGRAFLWRKPINWFKHDSDATIDSKIRKLILRYGATGYAIYFHCLELIARDLCETNITFELEHDAEIIADDLRIDGTASRAAVDIVGDAMRYMVDLGLFQEGNGHIYCYKMLYRLDSSMTSNPRFREMITRAKTEKAAIMLPSPTHHDGIMLEDKRREEKREEENIAPESKLVYGECENVRLTSDGLEKLKAKFTSYWPLVLSEFSTAKAAKGYKYKCDYAALLKWDFSRILARPAPKHGKHCPRCGSVPMGTEAYCTKCAKDSIAETDDVQYWVEN